VGAALHIIYSVKSLKAEERELLNFGDAITQVVSNRFLSVEA
jgi:hypothetical protein